MAYIKSIMINENLENYKFNNNDNVIMNISKINIFVGSNNSGKSRLLRSICLDKNFRFNAETEEIKAFNELVKIIKGKINKAFLINNNMSLIGGVDKNNYLNDIEDIEYITEKRDINEMFLNKLKGLEKVDRTYYRSVGMSNYGVEEICEKLESISDEYIDKLEEMELDKDLSKKEFKRIYIPILRGLRKLGDSTDIFYDRTVKDYFKGRRDIEIFTGQNLYDDVLKLLCGDYKERNKLKEFENFLRDNFFDGREVTIIPKVESDVLHIKIGEEKEQPIYNLGDGIQSIIILTFNLFKYKGEDVLFFIEEPELYLHPGLQRKLIEIFLKEEFDTYQYFITSHSNHLLDLTLDFNEISIYKFNKEIEEGDAEEKDAKFNIENVNNDDSSVLKLLGVNNSSIFLSNCTIWVEGITDRLYIRKYLEIYQKEKLEKEEITKIYSEDIHYSFLEYSGGNITHWDFLDESEDGIRHNRICNKIFLIADSDNARKNSKKYKRHEKLKEFFGDRFCLLKSKEIENLLMPNIIKAVVNKLNNNDGSYFEKSTFNIGNYKNKNLGEFINNKIDEEIKKESNSSYKRKKNFSNGNTINNKVDFCKYAIDSITSLEDMSDEAIALCEKIYKFIEENNK